MRKRLNAGFTVEISLLMMLIIPILVGIIYLGFYLHNNAVLKSVAYEEAVCLILDAEYKAEAVEGKLIGARDIVHNVQSGAKEISVTYKGEMDIPGLVMRIFTDNILKIEGSVKIQYQDPGKTIAMMNSLRKLAEGVMK